MVIVLNKFPEINLVIHKFIFFRNLESYQKIYRTEVFFCEFERAFKGYVTDVIG